MAGNLLQAVWGFLCYLFWYSLRIFAEPLRTKQSCHTGPGLRGHGLPQGAVFPGACAALRGFAPRSGRSSPHTGDSQAVGPLLTRQISQISIFFSGQRKWLTPQKMHFLSCFPKIQSPFLHLVAPNWLFSKFDNESVEIMTSAGVQDRQLLRTKPRGMKTWQCTSNYQVWRNSLQYSECYWQLML